MLHTPETMVKTHSTFNLRTSVPWDSSLYIDRQSYPPQPLQPNYEADQFVDCYRTVTHFKKDINVSRGDYKKGYCLCVLDVDPYYSFSTKRRGHCCKFAKLLPVSAILIM